MTTKAERKQKRWENNFGSLERVSIINSLPCVICKRIPSQNAHGRSRGSGGKWQSIVPLCQIHHHEQHFIGIQTFQNKYSVDLDDIAEFLAELIPKDGVCNFEQVLVEYRKKVSN